MHALFLTLVRHRVYRISSAIGWLVLASVLGAGPAQASRIKEVAAVEGVRSNQLTGFGLVVGLDGTGDQTTQMPYTAQGLTNYLQQLGITLPAASVGQLQLKNVAAVLVTAQLPAFARPGQACIQDFHQSAHGRCRFRSQFLQL